MSKFLSQSVVYQMLFKGSCMFFQLVLSSKRINSQCIKTSFFFKKRKLKWSIFTYSLSLSTLYFIDLDLVLEFLNVISELIRRKAKSN